MEASNGEVDTESDQEESQGVLHADDKIDLNSEAEGFGFEVQEGG